MSKPDFNNNDFDYDLFVIGAGSGGVRAGRMAASKGLRVGVAEESRPGGTCVVRGCVPKKFLVYGAEYGASLDAARRYGWEIEQAKFNWPTLRDAVQQEVERLTGIYAGVLERNGAELISERAVLTGPNTVELQPSGRVFTAKTILIAVGGRPWVPPGLKGAEHAIVSDDAFTLKSLPKRVLMIGGGFIACEFAGIFAGLGVKTIQAYRGHRLLNGFDPEVRDMVSEHQNMAGIETRFHISPTEIRKTKNGYDVSFDDGSQIETDLVFMATGRRPYTGELGLDKAGVDVDAHGAIIVNEFSESSQPGIYAVGDVTNRVNLTPVAIREAMAFVKTICDGVPTAYDHENIAHAVFTRPPVGAVGLTEGEARKRYGENITVYDTRFRPMKNIIAGKDQRCSMKLITKGKDETVIGIHIVGDDSPEIIQALGICIKAGLTKADFDATCAVHPTLAEEIVTLSPRELNKATVVT